MNNSALAATGYSEAVKKFASNCLQTTAKLGSYTYQAVSKETQKNIHDIKNLTPKKIAIGAAKFPFKFTWSTAKGSFYPIWAIGKGSYEYLRSKEPTRKEAIKEVFENRLAKDKLAMLIGGALWSLQQTTGLTANQYHSLTSEFDEDDGEEGIIVILDNFKGDRDYPDAGNYVYRRLYLPKYGKKVVFLSGVDLENIPAALAKISKELGAPIKKLDYYGHGLVGKVVGYGGYPGMLVGASSYAGEPIYDRKGTTSAPLNPNGWSHSLFATKIDPSIFAPNAKIRFNSCFVGNGPDGELFPRTIANSWLRRGGKVYTSNVQIFPSAGEYLGMKNDLFIPPAFVRNITDHLTPIRGAMTAFTLLYQIPKEIQPDKRVKGPFLWPGSRITVAESSGESPLRNEFERAWASELAAIKNTAIFNIYSNEDILHYAKVNGSKIPAWGGNFTWSNDQNGDGITKPIGVKLSFRDSTSASEYFKNIIVDKDLLEPATLSGNTIFINSKPDIKTRINKKEESVLIEHAEKAKELLKVTYNKNRDKKDADRFYKEYLELLPLYTDPYYFYFNKKRDEATYKRIDGLKQP